MKNRTKVLAYTMCDNLEVDDFIKKATTANPKDFLGLIRHVIALLKKEQKQTSTIARGRLLHLKPSGKANIVGDLHGDLRSLAHILDDSGFLKKTRTRGKAYLIFLGDYGDRGSVSPEVYLAILKLKESCPDKVILMRGNHEGPEDMLPCPHELPIQLKQKYGEEAGGKIMKELRKLFNHLYTAVIIEERAVLIHGGAPSKARSTRDLAYAHRRHPKESHLEEMLWSDPQEKLKGTQPSYRGAGQLFGPNVTRKILKMLNVKILIRGHEFSEEGFKINHSGRVLTLFSTNQPPYGNKYAAYLQLNLSMKINNAQQLTKYIRQFE